MSNPFNMSDWRHKYVLMAENDSNPESISEYDPKIHGMITSYEDVYFEPEEEPTEVIITVGTEKDKTNAKEIHVSFKDLRRWSRQDELPFEEESDWRVAAEKYLDETYSKYFTPEGVKSIMASLRNHPNVGSDLDETSTKTAEDLMKEVIEEGEVDTSKILEAMELIRKVVKKYSREMDDDTAYAFHKELQRYFNKNY